MARRYPALPRVWLVSDSRNDGSLEAALKRLPRGSGFIFRHYHLGPEQRQARFLQLAKLARAHDHLVIVAGAPALARRWGADGAYGTARLITAGPNLLRLVTAHTLGDLRTGRADAVLLSPVFATRSHPGARTLGPLRFRLLAARSQVPVIALGGMTARNSERLAGHAWAAIDGLTLKDS